MAILVLAPAISQARLITYEFEGTFNQNSMLFAAGDTFSGSYTFESSAPQQAHPDSTLNTQAGALNDGYAGTIWDLTVNSSVMTPFTIGGSRGAIAIGNDTWFGDRYIATMNSSDRLPLGLYFWGFQIDIQDTSAAMLDSGGLDVFPSLSFANVAGGRFFIGYPSSGCSQCQITLTSLTNGDSNAATSVPEPTTIGLLLAGIAGLQLSRRKGRKINRSSAEL